MQSTARKKMWWKVAAVGGVLLAGSGVLVAQAARQRLPQHQVMMLMGRVQKELNLSDEQSTKIKTIIQEAVPRGIEIHDDMKLAPEVKRAQLHELRRATQAKIAAILTPSQRKKAAKWRAAAPSVVKQRLERVADELKLTPGQRAKIAPMLSHSFLQAKALRDDMTLTVAQKFARLQQLRQATRSEINGVLTSQQRAQLDKIMAQMRSQAQRQFGFWRGSDPKP
jgi:Spy/CpxP family protein refolding chaperone